MEGHGVALARSVMVQKIYKLVFDTIISSNSLLIALFLLFGVPTTIRKFA